MKKLIDADLLTLQKAPSNRDLIDYHELYQLLIQCRGTYVKGEIDGISFYDALIKYSVNGLSIVKIIEFTKSKVLNPFHNKKDAKLSDCLYHNSELMACVERLNQDFIETHGYYLTEVIKILGIGEKTIHSWIRAD